MRMQAKKYCVAAVSGCCLWSLASAACAIPEGWSIDALHSHQDKIIREYVANKLYKSVIFSKKNDDEGYDKSYVIFGNFRKFENKETPMETVFNEYFSIVPCYKSPYEVKFDADYERYEFSCSEPSQSPSGETKDSISYYILYKDLGFRGHIVIAYKAGYNDIRSLGFDPFPGRERKPLFGGDDPPDPHSPLKNYEAPVDAENKNNVKGMP